MRIICSRRVEPSVRRGRGARALHPSRHSVADATRLRSTVRYGVAALAWRSAGERNMHEACRTHSHRPAARGARHGTEAAADPNRRTSLAGVAEQGLSVIYNSDIDVCWLVWRLGRGVDCSLAGHCYSLRRPMADNGDGAAGRRRPPASRSPLTVTKAS